ncbi:MAG: HEPN domain-containing protein [Candidatus Omnitrophota bacterium]|nr:HEPN domain-containing protein [Candidatus Omnitrophota bacterium]
MNNSGIRKDIQYWVNISRYDFDTAFSLLKGRRYLYVLFMCQQSVEKMLKGLIIFKTKKFPPRIHDLVRLAELAGLEKKQIDFEFLDRLSFYYIESRYPEEYIKLHKTASKKLAGVCYKKTKEICIWIEHLLK